MNNYHHNNIKQEKEKKEQTMRRTESKDVEVNAPASEVWQVYGMLRIEQFNTKYLSHVVRKVEVLEGDGRVGTTIKLHLSPGYLFDSYKEKYTKVDMEKRMLEAQLVEGGFLDIGFNLFLYRAEVIERSEKSCVIKLTIEYEADEGVHPSVALPGLNFIVDTAKAVADYALKNKKT